MIQIRQAQDQNFEQIWPIFHAIVARGDTYTYPMDTTYDEAQHLWMQQPQRTYVAESEGRILGTYYLKPNQPGGGQHVCNCGYMVAEKARGQGIATSLCRHSQQIARALGYKAMQFNFVIATNQKAIRLWQKLGYDIVGRLPKAFYHPQEGYVDALVMYLWLDNKDSASTDKASL